MVDGLEVLGSSARTVVLCGDALRKVLWSQLFEAPNLEGRTRFFSFFLLFFVLPLGTVV